MHTPINKSTRGPASWWKASNAVAAAVQMSFGQELIASVDAFLALEMNTSSAANLLVVHPNTLRYRINLVKEYCGLSLKSASEISEVWWALRRYEWSKNTGHGSA